MKKVIDSFGILVVFLLFTMLGFTLAATMEYTSNAKEYKAAIIAEIENSNFNPKVIDACKTQATTSGYEVDISNILYDENNFNTSAEVVLKYKCKIPFLGISLEKETRGLAK